MSDVLTMPRLGETMDRGRLVGWLVEEGESFRRGQPILEIETDKTVAEVPAMRDGTLVEKFVGPGEDAEVGAPLGRLAGEGKASADPGPSGMEATDGASVPGEPDAAGGGDGTAPVPAPPRSDEGRAEAPPVRGGTDAGTGTRATPAARRLARERGIAIAQLVGTGRRGRVERADVERADVERSLSTDGTAERSAPPGLAEGSGVPLTREARLSDKAAPVRILDTADGPIAYAQSGPAGAERTVLLLHGFGGDHTAWARIARGLSRSGLRTLAPDLPGHGDTGVEAVDPDGIAATINAFADGIGLRWGGTDVLAHSLGAVAAVRAVASLADAEIPRRLTLIAPAGLGSEVDRAFLRDLSRADTGGTVAHALRRLGTRAPLPSPALLDAMARRMASGRLHALADALAGPNGQRIDIVGDLGAIAERLPVRVVWGTADPIVPWQQVLALPSRVAIHLVAGAGHMPQWDRPAEVLALMEG